MSRPWRSGQYRTCRARGPRVCRPLIYFVLRWATRLPYHLQPLNNLAQRLLTEVIDEGDIVQ